MTQRDIKHVQAIAKSSWKNTYEGIIPRMLGIFFNCVNLNY